MIYHVYAIRDSVSGEYLAPMLDQTDDLARRNYRHTVMIDHGLLSTHTTDYDLYCIGTYDSETGRLTPAEPVLTMRGADIDVHQDPHSV